MKGRGLEKARVKKKKKKAQPKSPKDWVLNFDPIANILQNLGRIT